MSIKAVLFDLDDTLLWDERSVAEAFQATCKLASEMAGVDARELEQLVRAEARELYAGYDTYPFTQMIGINPFEALWAHFTSGNQPEFRRLQELAPTYRKEAWTRGLRKAGIDDAALGERLADVFGEERRARPITYEETFKVLDALKEDGYSLLLLTNGSPDLQREKLAGVPELPPYFDHILISGDFGRGKPDVAIFEHAISLLGISASEGIMVGDKLTTDILGSGTLGMRNIWINHHLIQRSPDIAPTYEVNRLSEIISIIRSLG